MHKLLQRQLRQARGDNSLAAPDLDALLDLVNRAYCEIDRERRVMNHAYQVMRDEQAELARRQMKAQETMAEMRAATAEADRARAVAEAQLLKQERLSVLGQLTATVAHELRNPLSAIGNSLHMIRETEAGADRVLERPLARIERSILRCNSIISDLLDYARARALERETISLDPWLEEVLEEQRLPRGIALDWQLGAPGARVAIDPDRFRRVIINVVENAAQAIFGEDCAEKRITVATAASAAKAEIAIDDTGPGIPPEVLPRIFEPLFSTKSFGTGLGLPTVKQIVEQHDGSVVITNGSTGGASVRIHLPLAAAPPATNAAA